MDIRKVKKLIELLDESGIAEIEIKEGEESVRISRSVSGQVVVSQPSVLPPAMPAAAPAPASPAAAPAAAEAPAAEPAAESSGKHIKAPMVGTFYSSSSPGAKPFVAVGDEVHQGQTVCIIEAMKMLNQVEADCSGKVLKILAENGQPIEFGQPLFEIG